MQKHSEEKHHTWVERGFSIMKKIKTADRNRLSDNMLSMLIMEKINLDDDFSDEHLRG
jgi:hypothetical protein